MSLYHKYRPQKWKELFGQEHIKTTLTNVLASGKITHGFLFSGPKGSGKTTTARLLAKSLNCQNRKKGEFESCGKCLPCLEIAAGRALDVIEIDAASNRGIDEIRELRDKVRFAPGTASYKVYIIDEVHMLTKEAFNALLKTLEEPPSHAVFVMATTEPQKVPATIISRVQHFDFRRATNRELLQFLKKISAAEKILIDEEALNLIIDKAEGSYRDALGILEQAVASLTNPRQKLTLEICQKALGLPAQKIIKEFSAFLLVGESKKALEILHQNYEKGIDIAVFNEAMIDFLRRKMLENPSENQGLVALIEELFSAQKEMKFAPTALLPLEMVVVARNKEQVAGSNPEFEPELKPGLPKDLKPFPKNKWQEILAATKKQNHSLVSLLLAAKPLGWGEGQIKMVVKFDFHREQICQPRKRKVLEQIFSNVMNQPCRLDCVVDKNLNLAVNKENDIVKDAEEIFETE